MSVAVQLRADCAAVGLGLGAKDQIDKRQGRQAIFTAGLVTTRAGADYLVAQALLRVRFS
jgi:hypothetical protein